MHKLYNELAPWWPLLSAPADYAEEAVDILRAFGAAGLPASATLLELGSGGGNNALHLKRHFASVTLTDLSPHMLAVSRSLNPDCEHLEGDMRTVRLGRQFDAVFVHDAIDYMTTRQDLQQAIETAYLHCKPGGVALFLPDYVSETFKASTHHGGEDGPDRSLRYLEWTHAAEPGQTAYVTEFVYMLREGKQLARVEYDYHLNGLFPRADWLGILAATGFRTEVVPDSFEREMFVARRPLR